MHAGGRFSEIWLLDHHTVLQPGLIQADHPILKNMEPGKYAGTRSGALNSWKNACGERGNSNGGEEPRKVVTTDATPRPGCKSARTGKSGRNLNGVMPICRPRNNSHARTTNALSWGPLRTAGVSEQLGL